MSRLLSKTVIDQNWSFVQNQQKWIFQVQKYWSNGTFEALKQLFLTPAMTITQVRQTNKMHKMSRPILETVIAQI